jgi:hypothetical protein
VISDEAWAVLGPLFPAVKATGRPPVDRRTVIEATARNHHSGQCLAATLHWVQTFSNTA